MTQSLAGPGTQGPPIPLGGGAWPDLATSAPEHTQSPLMDAWPRLLAPKGLPPDIFSSASSCVAAVAIHPQLPL